MEQQQKKPKKMILSAIVGFGLGLGSLLD